MNARQQWKTSEEIELKQKSAELAALRARHADADSVLQQLRGDIARFEQHYDRILGHRIAELERIEAEITRLAGYGRWDYQRGQSSFFEAWDETFRRDDTSEAAPPPSDFETEDIKALYREVAKTIHPDLVGAGPAKSIRHELMTRANRAYAEADSRTLQEILRTWRRSPDHEAQAEECGSELARLIRLIAKERQEIRTANAQAEDLKTSYIWRFKKRVEASQAIGIDLLADMVADAELDIARALRRLTALQGQRPQEPVKKPVKQKRKVFFPELVSCGTVHLRDRASVNYGHWRKFAEASGCLEIDVDQAVRLDIKVQAAAKLRHLRELKSDDLQSLYLYDVCDADLDSIAHLTGLEELYLSGPGLTDAALSRISSLRNLKRIYLYQTNISDKGLSHLLYLPGLSGITSSGNEITDAGLACVQMATGVKTVSFDWNR
jgi:hypothetical protein